MMLRCNRQLGGIPDYYCSTISSCHWGNQIKMSQHSKDFTFDLWHAEKLLMDNIETITIAPFLLFPSDDSLNANVTSHLTMFRDFQRIGERPKNHRSVVQGIARRVGNGQFVFLKIKPRAVEWMDREFDREWNTLNDVERFDWGPFAVLVKADKSSMP